MPDRIIRDELLDSERWLSLKDNADRLIFVAMVLQADDFGNVEASPWAVMRLGLNFGITTPEHGAQSLVNLVEAGLIMIYQHQADNDLRGPKQYAHIPRFRQKLRFPRKAHPLPPWQLETYDPDVTGNAWREKIRPTVLARDGHKCLLCGASDWLNVDHIVPLARGGKSVMNNLATLCRRCNTKKGSSIALVPKLQELIKDGNCRSTDPQLTLNDEEKRSEEKRSEEKRRKTNSTPPAVALTLPDWIPKEHWQAWIDARKKRRNPPTEFALKLAVAKLDSLRETGQHPAAVLAQSAFRGWAGLFPVKEDQ